MDLWALVVLPLGLGLLGFVEPCTVGSSLLFVKYLEGRRAAAKLLETAIFALTRALFIGALGAVAALVGSAFLDAQRWFWVLLGAAYVLLGVLYLTRQHGRLVRVLGPTRNRRGAAALGVLFGLNIPACAAPLLGAVFAASLGTASVAQGFWVMTLFGLALSGRRPFWTGVVFVLLGAWSAYSGLTV